METGSEACFSSVSPTVKVSMCGPTMIFMTANSQRGSSTGMGSGTHSQAGRSISGSGPKAKLMGMGYSRGRIRTGMRDSGARVRDMAVARTFFKMETHWWANTLKVNLMVKASTNGLQALCTPELSEMARSMVEERTRITEIRTLENT